MQVGYLEFVSDRSNDADSGVVDVDDGDEFGVAGGGRCLAAQARHPAKHFGWRDGFVGAGFPA